MRSTRRSHAVRVHVHSELQKMATTVQQGAHDQPQTARTLVGSTAEGGPLSVHRKGASDAMHACM
jgi:hypothetical protein